MTAAIRRKNLLLCFDAFGTLFTPSVPVPVAYTAAAYRHGIECGSPKDPKAVEAVATRFKNAYKHESEENPNYGKATGLGATTWWTNVISTIFKHYLKPGQKLPTKLASELLRRYSTKEGYRIYSDVLPFFQLMREERFGRRDQCRWPWDRIVIGIITNSDDRVPGILKSFGLNIGPRRVNESSSQNIDHVSGNDVDFVVLSYDAVIRKPDRRIFDTAVEILSQILERETDQLTVSDFDKLYIGDEVDKDYEAARAAGWDSVLLRRQEEDTNEPTSNEKLRSAALETIEVARKDGIVLHALSATSLMSLQHFCPERKPSHLLSTSRS